MVTDGWLSGYLLAYPGSSINVKRGFPFPERVTQLIDYLLECMSVLWCKQGSIFCFSITIMSSDIRLDALQYHSQPRPGKVETLPCKPCFSQRDLTLAYSPGVAEPCLRIKEDPSQSALYTGRSNLVGVVTNGTAVLGLGNIGPDAAKPVMEGKGVLFKVFADIDVFDIELNVKEPEKLIAGLKVMLKLFPNAKGTLAVEDNKPDAIALLKKLTKDETDISVAALHTKYPQGSERHLIYAVTGRAINSSMLPADAGCIVDNVDTVVAINQAVREGKPLMHRIVTVTGDAVANPQNFIVRIGTNYNELIEEAGGFVQEPAKIISGGPMMGFGIFDLNVPTTKTSSALLCLTHDDVADSQPSACINCGRCVEVCPGRVVPKLLADYAERHDLERFEACNGLECCECGCCSYVCPAKRPLTQAIKSARKMVLAEKKKKQQEAKK